MNDSLLSKDCFRKKNEFLRFPLTAILEDFPLIVDHGFLLIQGLGFHSPQNQMFSHSYTKS